MKTLSCRDMGVDCDFVAKADTIEETVKIATDHAMEAHAEKIVEMSKTMSQDEMIKAMMSAVKDM